MYFVKAAIVFAGIVSVGCSPLPSAFAVDDALQAACAAQPGDRPSIDGISVHDGPSAPGDLPSLRVVSDETGAFLRIYYDPGSQQIARARAACLGAQLALVERETGDQRLGAEWASAVFTQDPDYLPPSRDADVPPRWVIAATPDGRLSTDGHMMVVHVIPHEQVHAWQMRGQAILPRWVLEGHARWVQNRIAPFLDPAMARSQAVVQAAEAAKTTGPVQLAQWGSEQPKREAILRQVSAEDRARMEADPNYFPTGTFTFTADDFEDNAVSIFARYAAAQAVFEGLEHRHGAHAVRNWMAAITGLDGPVSPEVLAASVRKHFNEHLDALIAD